MVLIADVIEHIEDYLGFVKGLKGLGRYTIFVHVVAGMPAVDRNEMCDPLVRAVRVGK